MRPPTRRSSDTRRPLVGGLVAAFVGVQIAAQSACGVGVVTSPIQDIAPRRSILEQRPIAHTGQIEEFFGQLMAAQYGPDWHRWMPERMLNDHYRRYLMQRLVGISVK